MMRMRKLVPGLVVLASLAVAQNPEAQVAPALRVRVEPKYTAEAFQASVVGKAILTVKVDANGVPTDVRFVRWIGKNGGDPLGLDRSAVEAVRQWRFYPKVEWGKAVPFEASILVEFDFRHRPEQAPKGRA